MPCGNGYQFGDGVARMWEKSWTDRCLLLFCKTRSEEYIEGITELRTLGMIDESEHAGNASE